MAISFILTIFLLAKQQKKLKDMFDLFDADCSGYLSKDELVVLLQSIGYYPSDEWVTETMVDFRPTLTVLAKSSKCAKVQTIIYSLKQFITGREKSGPVLMSDVYCRSLL